MSDRETCICGYWPEGAVVTHAGRACHPDCALEACEDRLALITNALARLDGHTCHEGCTDAEHLPMYRAVVAEIRAAVGGGA